MGWKNELYDCMLDVSDEKIVLPNKISRKEIHEVDKKYPIRVPNYYYEVACGSGCLLKTCIPSIRELESKGEEDTSGESISTIMPGVQHKYEKTVLMLTTNECAMYCRYCFRKRMVGISGEEVVKNISEACDYIEKHEEIDNVLLSGGDSLMMDNYLIAKYLERLTKIEHLACIRFGTKIPVVYPKRIINDDQLLDILEEYGKKKQIYIITQFNHSDEITEMAQKAIALLKERGMIIRNQSVLLKGVNDDPETICRLLKKLVGIGILPYYIFQCRPVRGAKDIFQVPLDRGYEIIEQAKKNLNGLEKCFRYICSTNMGKVEILGIMENFVIYKFHEARDKELIGKIISQDLKEEDRWIINF